VAKPKVVTGPWRAGGQQIIPRPPNWQLGNPAPWADADEPARVDLDVLCERITRRGAGEPPQWSFDGAVSSAVLVALFDGERGAEVLLTRRAWHLRSHKGEVCFPGGRQDPGESPVQTALRESFEEVQLDPEAVRLIGELDQIATKASNSHIIPIVGRLQHRPDLAAGTSEVDRIFTVPLVDFLRADTYREEQWHREDTPWSLIFFELDDETIWGATARILKDLLVLATARDT
jgi:8-oxo-dGTP pyrophosphatase MutT (NUDIX family)